MPPNIPNMKRVILIPALALLAACTQEKPAPIVYKGSHFYGKDGAFDRRGNELPKYSEYNPAPMDGDQAAKYTDQDYGVSAEINTVEAVDLTEPSAPVETAPIVIMPPKEEMPAETVVIDTPYQRQQQRVEPDIVMPSAPEPIEEPVLAPLPELSAAPPISLTTYDPKPSEPKSSFSSEKSFLWPVRGEVISGFGSKSGSKRNEGINIKARSGEPVRAAGDGVVVYADNRIGSYGNMVIVQHQGEYLTAYAHASDMVVKKGDHVVKGQLIGFVGDTGGVSEPQLHFSVRKNKISIDPKPLLVDD